MAFSYRMAFASSFFPIFTRDSYLALPERRWTIEAYCFPRGTSSVTEIGVVRRSSGVSDERLAALRASTSPEALRYRRLWDII